MGRPGQCKASVPAKVRVTRRVRQDKKRSKLPSYWWACAAVRENWVGCEGSLGLKKFPQEALKIFVEQLMTSNSDQGHTVGQALSFVLYLDSVGPHSYPEMNLSFPFFG